jgi:hypothetical protein
VIEPKSKEKLTIFGEASYKEGSMVGSPRFESGSRESKICSLERFQNFCMIDLQLTQATAKIHQRLIKNLL